MLALPSTIACSSFGGQQNLNQTAHMQTAQILCCPQMSEGHVLIRFPININFNETGFKCLFGHWGKARVKGGVHVL